jgi:hypothetical protein
MNSGYNTYTHGNVTMKLPVSYTNRNVFFQKQRTGRQNRSCLGGLVSVGGEGYKERVKESKYGGNNAYSCKKMEK